MGILQSQPNRTPVKRNTRKTRNSARKSQCKTCCMEHTSWNAEAEYAESAQAWDGCMKNPGHKNFIPVENFGDDGLPKKWRKKDFVEFIKISSNLTVRLRVSRTSPDYSLSYGACPEGPRVGTGFIYNVEPSSKCSNDAETSEDQTLWNFHISTAKHVIFDDYEAEHTFVDLFFDNAQSKAEGRMRTLKGIKIRDTDNTGDSCAIISVCDDGRLAAELKELRNRNENLRIGLKDWLQKLNPKPAVIVSHPHGWAKHVTVGKTLPKERKQTDLSNECYYSTDTCPGSSGAHVLGVLPSQRVTHSGCSGAGKHNKGFISPYW